jgi:hypothetical protein
VLKTPNLYSPAFIFRQVASINFPHGYHLCEGSLPSFSAKFDSVIFSVHPAGQLDKCQEEELK